MSYVSNLLPYIADILPMSLNFGCRNQGKVWHCLEVHISAELLLRWIGSMMESEFIKNASLSPKYT